ncbi:NAD(P)/FAD-dependent oxidoreductase [Agrobacterium larrymoorei]|uniref:FAD-binding oxidoreductase n=1 Tax=Agrobacterium larrymoorei TaxID=160699 RepID=A0A4D7DVJ3_9HYPH|nr:FAD-binding oxidoreductase [Agrobacterium larrymoorei]QCJ01094.1 FAD-binding oxidoreductase [Agrobacterium larrymoorei]QYA10108.1 FAD-binding oxidoreductase [Agrobacterium larrymoorei]
MNIPLNVDEADVIVIGAGIVGLCCALSLQRAGRNVTIVDPMSAGKQSSYGNAGLLSACTNSPIALPGMWRKVPGWMLDRNGPLAVSPKYLPVALPWLVKWLAASRMSVVRRSSDALYHLHHNTMSRYRELLGNSLFEDLIRTEGSVSVFEGETETSTERVIRYLADRHSLGGQDVSAEQLKEIFPAIGPRAKRGIYFPRNGWTVNPGRLTATLLRLFHEAGGKSAAEKVLKLIPGEGYVDLFTNSQNRRACKVVIATGSWAKELLAPLGVKLPLETERGYHVMLEGPSLSNKLPILLRDSGMAITPMEHGLRLAGGVEIAGLVSAPNETRCNALYAKARAIFPTLQADACKQWMGFRPSLPDSVAAIGAALKHKDIFVAVGHGHTGMVGASETSSLIRDLVLNRPTAIDPKPYSLGRFN